MKMQTKHILRNSILIFYSNGVEDITKIRLFNASWATPMPIGLESHVTLFTFFGPKTQFTYIVQYYIKCIHGTYLASITLCYVQLNR